MTAVPLYINWLTNQPMDIAATPSFVASGTGAVFRTWQDKAREIESITDFGCVGDGTTNNFSAMQAAITAAAGKRLYVPEGTYAITLPSATSLGSPASNFVLEGAGKDISTLQFTLSSTSFLNIFTLSNPGIAFKNLTLQIIASDNQQCTLFSMQASNLKFQNCIIKGGVVEGVRIGGTATNLDQVEVIFTSGALAGSPITIASTVSTGQTTAQIASGLATAINANATISAAGIVATANGSFVGIAQPDTLNPQASYTTAVTGAGTETMTIAPLAAFNTWTCSNTESDDVLIENIDVSNMSWSVLKSNATTGTNRRWSFRGGRYNQIINGGININSPSGTFDDVLIQGVSVGSVSTNSTNGLPIAFSHVTNARIIGNALNGTYNQNAIHVEENSSGLAIVGNVINQNTSKAYGTGYNGTAIYLVDNNVGGHGFVHTNDVSIIGNTCLDATGTTNSGYGLAVDINTTVAQRYSISGNTLSGYSSGMLLSIAHFNCVGNAVTSFVGGGTGITITSAAAAGIVSDNTISAYGTALAFASTTVVIRDNPGYNPVGTQAAVNMGASPFTITGGPSPETHYVNQNGTNTATMTKGTRAIGTLVNASTYYPVHLEPFESYVTTWATTAPSVVKDIH